MYMTDRGCHRITQIKECRIVAVDDNKIIDINQVSDADPWLLINCDIRSIYALNKMYNRIDMVINPATYEYYLVYRDSICDTHTSVSLHNRDSELIDRYMQDAMQRGKLL